MKLSLLLIMLLSNLIKPCIAQPDVSELCVMTFNIRYDNPGDGEYAWTQRKPIVLDVIANNKPDIIGMQEVLKSQLDTLMMVLPGYDSYGVGRDDGNEAGEYVPVFYRRSRFELLEQGTFWLSDKPETPGSIAWGSACKRIVSWVKLEDKLSRQTLYVFNTHFDYLLTSTRIKSARLLKKKIKQIAGSESQIIVMGDFNEGQSGKMYQIITSPKKSGALRDTRAHATKREGPQFTFVGFPFSPDSEEPIDMVFFRGGKQSKVVRYKVDDYNRNGKYPSDHLPVVVWLQME